METILVTGFEPFGGEEVNPSQRVAQLLDGEVVAGARVRARILPVEFAGAGNALRAAVDDLDPIVVVSLGQAGGRTGLSVERVAINVMDARIPDNVGAQPVDVPIRREGPIAYWTALPYRRIVTTWAEHGIPGSISNSAGTFICNLVMYEALALLAERSQRTVSPATASLRAAGFIHVPYSPEQAIRHPERPSMPIDLMVEGVRLAIGVSLTDSRDLVP